ncbi:MAG: hypothetical protein AAGJ35_15660, partial [Myxococcota bacterium]
MVSAQLDGITGIAIGDGKIVGISTVDRITGENAHRSIQCPTSAIDHILSRIAPTDLKLHLI